MAGAQATTPSGAKPAMRITLGQSLFKLTGPWHFHVGDSPRASGSDSPLWAMPRFQDSNWESVDLTPSAGSFDPTLGFGDYVTGWTARGHPGYSGYAWYRLSVEITEPSGEKLGIEGPANVDDVYQVFVNGRLIGSFGRWPANGKHPTAFVTRPKFFRIPQDALIPAPHGSYTAVIAFRVWMDSATQLLQPDVGGLHTAPLLGSASAVDAQYRLGWWQQIRSFITYPILAGLFLLLAIIALSLGFVDRNDYVYLWLAGTFVMIAVAEVHLAVACWTEFEGLSAYAFTMMTPLILGGWVLVWWYWFRLKRPAWMPSAILGLSLAYFVVHILEKGAMEEAPALFLEAMHLLEVALPISVIVLLVYIVVRGVREEGREAWLTLPAILLVGIAQFQQELDILHVPVIYFPFGVQVAIGDIANLALLGAMFLLLVRRFRLSILRQRELALHVKQAQEVQHVLLPEPVHLPSMIIETDYRPAREVGGDFFQIIPHEFDGSVLIVVGDVAGKGLPAGMLVALLVGAIRSIAELDDDPQRMLVRLNRRLLGRGDAHATCLALHIAADGTLQLANAGHLPPYLNGAEVPVEGSLPLGSFECEEFPVSRMKLNPGDHLIFASDGIVEATDRNGNLFGFDRLAALLQQPRTAAELAEAAQHFGQQDDISVVSIVCLAEEAIAQPRSG